MAQKKLDSYISNIIKEGMTNSSSEKKTSQHFALSCDEIRLLEFMCYDGKSEDYFKKLLDLYEDEKSGEVSNDVKELCFLKLGQKLVKKVEKQPVCQTSYNNIHIRGEVLPNIVEFIKKKAKQEKNSVFLLPTENKINFSPQPRPQILSSMIEIKQYVEIIRHVNHIIQNEIYKEKYGKKEKESYWFEGIILCTILTMITIVINIFSPSETTVIITSLFLVLTYLVTLAFSLQTYREEVNTVGLVIRIYEEIKKYFSFLNGVSNNNLQWKIGEYFFWIQIKMLRREYYIDNDEVFQKNELEMEENMVY